MEFAELPQEFAELPKKLAKLPQELIRIVTEFLIDKEDICNLRLLNKRWLYFISEIQNQHYREAVATDTHFYIRANTNIVQIQQSLIGWGNNQSGELGVGSRNPLTTPDEIWIKSNLSDLESRFQSLVFSYFVLGANFSLAVDQYNDIWMSGQDVNNISLYADKGYDFRQYAATYPIRILSQGILQSHIVEPITHIVPLMEEMLVVISGKTIFPSLDAFYESIESNANKPIKIDFSPDRSDETILDVKYGMEHALFLTNYGNVYGWGINNRGQFGLGYSEEEADAHKLRRIAVYNTQENAFLSQIIQVAATADSSYFLTFDGKLYVCGDNSNGELGLDANIEYQQTLSQVELKDGKKIVDIKAGFHHALCLTETGDVYTWGDNNYGQLASLSSSTPTPTPTLVWSTTKTKKPIVQIAAGANHTLLLTNECELWVCGDNSEGQLGLGVDSKAYYDRFIKSDRFEELALPNQFSTYIQQDSEKTKQIKPRSPSGISPVFKRQRTCQASEGSMIISRSLFSQNSDDSAQPQNNENPKQNRSFSF